MSPRIGRLLAIAASLTLLMGCATTAPTLTPTQLPASPPATSAASTPASSPSSGPTSSPTPALTPAPTIAPSATPETPITPTPTAPTTPAPEGITLAEAQIGAHLDALAEIAAQNDGLRAAGLPGYEASVEYVAGQLEAFGYEVQRQPFNFDFFDEAAPVSLTVGEQSWSGADWLHAMIYSAPGQIDGVLETVALEEGFSVGTGACEASDWAGFTAGHIAVLASGPCFRRQQIENAQQAGAIGVISIYPNWEQGQTRRPTLLSPDGITIPAIVAGSEPTLALLAAAQSGGTAQLSVQTISEPRTIENVVAELAGSTDRVVMLGGHLDGVLDGPGINDNGSGVATLLAIAQQVRAMPQPAQSIRFGFWGAEEFGDLGSAAYVEQLPPAEVGRISAYLNLDMVGSPNAARFVYDDALAPPGSAELTAALLAALDELGAPGERFDAGASSDHYAFGLAGIPTGGVFSGLGPLSDAQAQLFDGMAGEPADACYHLACDDRANVNLGAAVILGQATSNVLEDLAY